MFPTAVLNIIYSYGGEHKILYKYNKQEVNIEYKIAYRKYICCSLCGCFVPDLFIRFRYEYSIIDLHNYYCGYCKDNMEAKQNIKNLVPLYQKCFKINKVKFKQNALRLYGIGINYIYLIEQHRRHPIFVNIL